MNTRSRFKKRVLAVIAGVSLALTSLAVGSAAHAEPGPGQSGAPTAASLTIHKYAGTPVTTDPHDGTELPQAPDRLPLSGVTFTVTPVTHIGGVSVADLTDSAAWDAIAAYTTVPPNPSDFTLGTPFTMVTGADGSITQTGLPLGLYLVQETDAGTNPVMTPAQDFLVTLPMPTGAQGFNYDVHVYPKNVLDDNATKTVDDSVATGLGDTVTWTVTAPPLGAGAGGEITSFVMADTLDARLTYVPDSMAVTVGGTAVDPSFITTTLSAGTLTVSFTAAGLAHLNNQPAGTVVTFTFDTTVTDIGQIPNDATVTINTDSFETDVPHTDWGKVEITKTDRETNANLGGAVFEVYLDADATNGPVTVNGETQFTTAQDGTVTIPGLKAGDYWLKEVTAPAGYVTPTDTIPVTVVATGAATVDVSVTNDKQTVPQLPLTGAAGQLIMVLGGIALLLIAVGLVIVARRRRERERG